MRKCFKKIFALVVCCVMVLSCGTSAFAATVDNTPEEVAPCAEVNTYTFYREQGQSSGRLSFYYDASKGSNATFRLKATGTSDCYFRCEITTTSILSPTVLLPDVLGNDTSGEAATAHNLTSGWYQVVVIPVNGTTHGNTITFKLTVTQN